MARPQRIELANAFYHVSNGKKSGKPLFPSATHAALFMEQVLLAGRRFNVELHGWHLHKYHYQLLVKTPEANLSRFMRQVDGLYTLRCQQLQGRRGSVFATRYKSVLVQPALVSDVLHYLHHLAGSNEFGALGNSLSAYQGKQKPALPVRVEEILGSGEARKPRVKQQQNTAPPEQILHFFARKSRPALLGDAGFAHKIRATAARRAPVAAAGKRPVMRKIISHVAQVFKVSEGSIVQAARGPDSKNIARWVAMHLCQEAGGITLQVIAQHFGLQRYGTVSTTIGKLRAELPDNPRLKRQVNKLLQELG
jgi:putative transposase